MKSLIVFGILAVAISFSAGKAYNVGIQEIQEAFPGLSLGTPKILKVVFENGVSMDLGNEISPTQSKNQPLVDWNADPDSYYTLLVTDPDAPSRRSPYLKEIITWFIVNIKGNDLSTGDVLSEYISAGPPPGAGMNRYFYFLFKQPGREKMVFDHKRANKYTIDGRFGFSTNNFTQKNDLGSPVACNFFTSYFDLQTVALYKQLRCCDKYLSPLMKY